MQSAFRQIRGETVARPDNKSAELNTAGSLPRWWPCFGRASVLVVGHARACDPPASRFEE